MADYEDVTRYADTIMIMIVEDKATGQVPRGASSWSELDATVDTGDYCRQARLPAGHDGAWLRNAVAAEVSRRLAAVQGGPWTVTWTHPDGHTVAISRLAGYATRAEADAVGRDYRATHGGACEVHAV
jgi:hypothetical protein